MTPIEILTLCRMAVAQQGDAAEVLMTIAPVERIDGMCRLWPSGPFGTILCDIFPGGQVRASFDAALLIRYIERLLPLYGEVDAKSVHG